MSSPPATRVVRQTLPSKLDSYQQLLQAILRGMSELGWTDNELLGVHMALEESISNAIRHGNKEDTNKQVEVECRYSAEEFFAEVCDEGPGFCPSDVPDCCSPDRLNLPGGRGLALMRAYMSKVEYNARGNCVRFEKKRGE